MSWYHPGQSFSVLLSSELFSSSSLIKFKEQHVAAVLDSIGLEHMVCEDTN